MGENVVEICDLTFGYKPGSLVLKKLNMSFSPGSFNVILGGNGSGKSTLLRVLRGLLPANPGSLRYNGCQQWQEVGLVFQNPDNQIVGTTVLEDVSFGPANLGMPREQMRQRVKDALIAVGLLEKQYMNPHHLSGGERQRLALAGVLAMSPKVLLLDEATSMLDASGRELMLGILSDLRQEGLTVVHVTHHMDEAQQADQVWVLGQGNLRLSGKPAEVFAQEQLLRELGLGLPPEQQFVATIKQKTRTWLGVPSAITANAELAKWVATRPRLEEPLRKPAGAAVTPEARAKLENVDVGEILRGITTQITARQCTAIVGPSGAGKTTLARLIAGLVAPSGGSISEVGRCGLVLQYPEDQLFAATVLEDVMFGPLNQGLTKQQALFRGQQALAAVGLDVEVYGARNPATLSGGEKRKVAIAGVLAMQPELLILDEPTVGLDPEARAVLIKLLHQLKGQYTLVVISHDPDMVDALADHVMVLKGGRLLKSGTPLEVFSDPQLRKQASLSTPQRIDLLQKLQALEASGIGFYHWLKEVDLGGN